MTSPSGIMLAPLGALYGAVTRARLKLYQTGLLPTHKINAPVISVGNITTGGTGKTPLVEWIARTLSASDEARVCILTRGYGRDKESQRVVVSDGEHILADARTGGDEPCLLAETLLGVAAVVSDANRVSAARWAIKNLGSRLFILDDGFQHLRIERDLDIVTIDATNPWGGRHLLPCGRLREPLRGLARADLLVITRADQVEDISPLKHELERLSGGRPILLASTRTRRTRSLDGTTVEQLTGAVSSSPAAAFCAIGNPQSFFAHLREDGYVLSYTRAFADHHVYTQSDIETVEREAEARGARLLLTTAKDAVKLRSLRFTLPCYVLEVEIKLDDEEKLLQLLREAVNGAAQA
jgi:tetraacyldisaccharide 4'-kinase